MKFSEVNQNAKLERDKIVNRIKDVPEVYDGLVEVNTGDLKDTFVVERYHVVKKPDVAKNDETGKFEVKTSKAGNTLTITLVYVMFHTIDEPDKQMYFVTKSEQMLTQLWTDDTKKKEYEGRNGKVEVWDMDEGIDEPLTIGFVAVKYKNGKTYAQPILNIAPTE